MGYIIAFVLVGLYMAMVEYSYLHRTVKWCTAREKLFANLFLAASSQSRLDHPMHRSAILAAGIGHGQNWIPSKVGVGMLVSDFKDRVATVGATQQATQMIRDFELNNPVPKREVFFWRSLILNLAYRIPRQSRPALPKGGNNASARSLEQRVGDSS
jgi:hypothetical protein